MSPVDFSREPQFVFHFSPFSAFLKIYKKFEFLEKSFTKSGKSGKKEKRGNLEILPRGVQRLTPPCDLRTKPEHNGATSHRAAGTEPRRGIIARASNNTI